MKPFPYSHTTMTPNDFRALFAYGHWASERLLLAAEGLSEEQWTRDLGGSFPTLRDTFAHVLQAEWVWLRRWHGESPTGPPEWKDDASVPRLRAVLRELHADRERLLDTLTEDDFATVVRFVFLNGTPGEQPLGSLMMHVANHSTYHRGQIAMMLRLLGAAPPSTDLYLYNSQLAAQTPEPAAPA